MPSTFSSSAVLHPKQNDQGQPVWILQPQQPSLGSAWQDPSQMATCLPDGVLPDSLNGLAFEAWTDAPLDALGWNQAEGIRPGLLEPEFQSKSTKSRAAGVVIEEADGRVWLVHPTNAFGGYQATWPKGRQEPGLSLQATALKEAFEESGLKVQITGFLLDIERTTTVARYYRARRIGGTPAQAGWESQAVSLCPRAMLLATLNQSTDHPLAQLLTDEQVQSAGQR